MLPIALNFAAIAAELLSSACPVSPEAIAVRHGIIADLRRNLVEMTTNALRGRYAPALQTIAAGAPPVYESLVGAWAASAHAFDQPVVAAIQSRVEKILGAEVAPTVETHDTPEMAFVDQFVDYVADIDQQLRKPLLETYGKIGLRNFVDVVYIIDQSVRLSMTHQRLFAGVDGGGANAIADPEQVLAPTWANLKWHDVILAHGGLDDLTREIVRIRAGWYHQCGLCNSTRLVDKDSRVVVDSAMENRILEYKEGQMSPRHTAALRYADAYMVDPAGISTNLVDELRQHFTEAELLQLTLELSSWNMQKVLVALEEDKPLSTEGLTAFTIDGNGAFQVGKLLQPTG
jgi:alkylhydroperoxidase family enzyme